MTINRRHPSFPPERTIRSGGSIPLQSTTSKHKLCYRPGVIREIEIWRVALMVNRYADEAKLNSLRRAAELTVDGDHAQANIWRRVTIAIEQLTDRTGLLN
jgi:hypothetical protein